MGIQGEYSSNGLLERYKARLVVQGFSHKSELDSDGKFSPAAKITTICALLALTASNSWNLKQMDVKNAFLHN